MQTEAANAKLPVPAPGAEGFGARPQGRQGERAELAAPSVPHSPHGKGGASREMLLAKASRGWICACTHVHAREFVFS